jgi:hypothetical protein
MSPSPDFESGASTNSTTPALLRQYNKTQKKNKESLRRFSNLITSFAQSGKRARDDGILDTSSNDINNAQRLLF